MEAIFTDIAEALHLQPEDVSSETPISEETVDSLGVLTIITVIDEHFNVIIDRKRLMSFSSIGELLAYAQSHQSDS